MPYYGILKTNYNTGADNELEVPFCAPLKIYAEHVSSVTDTLSLRRKASRSGAQRWKLQAGVSPTENGGDLLVLFANAGYDRPLYIRVPQPVNVVLPDATALITVSGDYEAKADALLYSADRPTQLRRGSFINFDGDSKVYLIKDASASHIEIIPPLQRAVVNGTRIANGLGVTMKAFLETDAVLGITYEDGWLASPGSYTFVEAL